MEMIFKESYEMCPYIRELQRESRRNAEIRNAEKRREEDEADFPEAARMKAHLSRRIERQTKNKWYKYAVEYASAVSFADPTEKDAMRRYLQTARESISKTDKGGRKKEEKRFRRAQIEAKHAW